jgi:hypothetical protein
MAYSNHYQDFLLHGFPKLLEDVPLAVRACIWYMHDGAPAHFSPAVRDVLNNTYHDWRIGRGGPTAWPPRSPPLNPLDFYLWGHRRTPVYAARVDNEESLYHGIVDACEAIRKYPGIFERMRRSMTRRVEAYIKSHRGNFEHLLYMYFFNCNSKFKRFPTHVFMDVFAFGTCAQNLSSPLC